MSEYISIDSGSSYMKAYAGGEPLMFPGVVREVFPGEEHPSALTMDGRRWLVGEAAIRERADSLAPNRERWFHGSPEQHAQICHALARLGATGAHGTLAVTLPYGCSTDPAFTAAVSKRSTFEWSDAEGEHVVTFDNIQVTPQGVGALLHHQQSAPPFAAALMIDIGSCTTDIVAVREEAGEWRFLRDCCVSDQEASASLFFEMWRREVGRLPGFAGKPLGYYDLMPRLMDGEPFYPLRGEHVSLEASAEKAKVEYTRALKAVVKQCAGPTLWDEIDQIILTGGGAQCVNLDVWGDARTHRLNACANVLGQYSC